MDKETYEKKMQAQIDQWQAEIDKLKARAREASADMQGQYEQQLRELREKRDEMQAQHRNIQAASAEAWQDIKLAADRAWDEMANAMKAAWSRFS